MRTFDNVLAFSPELWLLVGAIVIVALARLVSAATTTIIAGMTLALAFLALSTQFKQTITILDGAFLLDGYAIVIDVVILGAALLSVLASRADVLPGEADQPAVPAFVLLATLGAMLAASAAEMIALFVALELLAVNLYVLTGLVRRGHGSMAASLGFLVIGAASSGLLLYGLALVFGLTGQTQLHAVGTALSDTKPTQAVIMLAVSLLIGGFAARIGLVPIRWWTRGFETGVGMRAVMFIQSAGVVTAFAVFGRLFAVTLGSSRVAYAVIIAIVAAIAMTAGNLLALTQTSIRRMLVYATVAQAAFALLAFTDLKRVGISALVIFLTALALTSISAFATVIAYTRSVHSDAIRDLAGMSRWSPGLALALSLSLLSLAGLPPLAGFLGKLLVLQAAVDGGYAWLAVVGAVNVLLAALAAVRVIRTLFIDPPVFEVIPARLDAGIRVAVTTASVGMVFMGLLLAPLYSAASYGQAALLH
jgi:NADH-quinone oxidoreductase subunit N